jgi:RNA polymerase sigma factor (sigma-70 family)
MELLERFFLCREERAFAELVRRHGPMVREVCGRIVGQASDADDAFQATFLILVQKARSLRKQVSVGSWLYGVATRVAWKARDRTDKARRCYDRTGRDAAPDPAHEAAWKELVATLNAEVAGLPPRYRGPVVLCYLESQTQDEAARQLGWSLRTLRRRLERARELLRLRLQRRGLTLSAALLTADLVLNPARAVSSTLARTTIRAACLLEGEVGLTKLVSVNVASLVEGVGGTLARFQLALVWAAALGIAGAGAGSLFTRMYTERPRPETLQVAADLAVGTQEGIARQRAPARTDLDGDPLPAGALRRLGSLRFRQGANLENLLPLPDGKTLVTSGSFGDTVNAWDLATGKITHRFPGNQAAKQIALTQDGKTLAVPQENSIHLWDPAIGKGRGQIPAGQGQLLSLAFSQDGKLIASAGIDKTIRLHEVATGRQVSQISVDLPRVSFLALMPDGKSLTAADETNLTTYPIDVDSGRHVRQLERSGYYYGFVLSPDGRTLAAGGQDGAVLLWDAATGNLIRSLTAGQKFVTAVAFSPDGRTLAWSEADPVGASAPIRVWDLVTGKEVCRLRGHGFWTDKLAFSVDGGRIYAGVRGGFIGQWDVATGKEITPPGANRFRVSAVFLSPDGATLAARALDQVHFWDVATGRELSTFPISDRETGAIAFSPNWRILAVGGRENTVCLWDVHSRRLIRRLVPKPTPDQFVEKPRPHPTISGCGLRDPSTREMVGAVAFSADGKQLVAGGWNATIRVWDCEAGVELRRFSWGGKPDYRGCVCGGE